MACIKPLWNKTDIKMRLEQRNRSLKVATITLLAA